MSSRLTTFSALSENRSGPSLSIGGAFLRTLEFINSLSVIPEKSGVEMEGSVKGGERNKYEGIYRSIGSDRCRYGGIGGDRGIWWYRW